MGSATSAFNAQGVPPEIPAVLFKYDLAMTESDLTVIDFKLDEIIGCLVKGLPKSWAPKTAWKLGPLPGEPPWYTLTANDYEGLYDKVQGLYLQKWLGDGLPCGAATKKRIDWLMRGVEKGAKDIVGADEGLNGAVRSSERPLTFELLAAAMAMAGGRPEYMCVAEAACKGLIKARITLASSASSSPI